MHNIASLKNFSDKKPFLIITIVTLKTMTSNSKRKKICFRLPYPVIAVVLNDVEHSRHLTEDENFVLSFEQRVQHLIQDFHLAANLDQVLVDEVEDSVFGQGVLDEVGVVGGLPHVHQSALDGEIEVGGAVGHVHFSVVGRRH